jgi:hypothetical protein
MNMDNRKTKRKQNKKTPQSRNGSGQDNVLPIPRDAQVIVALGGKARISTFPGLGIPDRIHMRLLYAESFSLSASNLVEYHYKGNGCYDPRAATGGSQPHYFDQMMVLYQQFYVRRSQASVQIVNRTVDTFGVALFASSQTTGLSDYYEAEEQQNKCVFTMIPPSQGDVKRLVLEESTDHMLANPSSINDSTTWGNNSADPTNLWYHRVLVQNLSQAVTTAGVFTLRIIYDVEFFDRREVGPSTVSLPLRNARLIPRK